MVRKFIGEQNPVNARTVQLGSKLEPRSPATGTQIYDTPVVRRLEQTYHTWYHFVVYAKQPQAKLHGIHDLVSNRRRQPWLFMQLDKLYAHLRLCPEATGDALLKAHARFAEVLDALKKWRRSDASQKLQVVASTSALNGFSGDERDSRKGWWLWNQAGPTDCYVAKLKFPKVKLPSRKGSAFCETLKAVGGDHWRTDALLGMLWRTCRNS
jgi:hypothetical protein